MAMEITAQQKRFFEDNGHLVVEGVFTPEEADFYRGHYTRMREAGNLPGRLRRHRYQFNRPAQAATRA